MLCQGLFLKKIKINVGTFKKIFAISPVTVILIGKIQEEIVLKKMPAPSDNLQITRLHYPGNTVAPDWVRKLFGAPTACGWGRSGKIFLQGWERYYQELFEQTADDSCCDFIYAAQWSENAAARMWFGYSRSGKVGNFGNVLTLPEFRRRGIMKKLLEQCTADFFAGDALILLCSASAAAAPAYEQFGFKRVSKQNPSCMALMKPEVSSLEDLLQHAYGTPGNTVIRPGRRSDRFELDKLLLSEPRFNTPRNCRNVLVNFIPDYMTAFQRVKPGSSALSVIESATGYAAGYAYLERLLPDTSALVYTVHPDFAGCCDELFAHVIKSLDNEVGNIIYCRNY